MSDPSVSRREFLATAAALGALTQSHSPAAEPTRLPHRVLGKTGVSVPILGLGTAPVGMLTEQEAVPFYHRCIDAGVTYLDTAPEFAGYGKAQAYLKPVLKDRRNEVFVVTKCFEPDGEAALTLLKKNFAELGIDRADLVYAHSLGHDRMDPAVVSGPNGVFKALEKAKRDGLTRFVGVTGHNRPGRFLKALDEWDYEVQMNAVSLVARHVYDFESKVWPKAAAKNVGLAAMKVYGGFPGKGPKFDARLPADLRHAALRYALGLPNVTLAVVGMKTAAELAENVGWVKAFQPLTAAELAALDVPTRDLAKKWGPIYGAVT